MTLNSVLLSLYEHLNVSQGVVTLGWGDARTWQNHKALDVMIKHRLLKEKGKAQSLECIGCEYRCFEEVLTVETNGMLRAFIVCHEPEMQSQMGRINVPLERLQQWQCSVLHIAKALQRLLHLDGDIKQGNDSLSIQLGMLKGKQGRRWVNLKTQPLQIEINQIEVPIDEVLFFENDTLMIDQVRIDDMLNSKEPKQGKRYIPSVENREIRKQETQAMYQNWRDAYKQIKVDHPDKSATWISKQIVKLPIAEGRNEQTIYKNMK